MPIVDTIVPILLILAQSQDATMRPSDLADQIGSGRHAARRLSEPGFSDRCF